jgi:VanZ family protein
MPYRSLALPLAVAYALLVVYASTYPFTGWRWPPGAALADLLVVPWLPWRGWFDDLSNLLGYTPLGALIFVAAVRGTGTRWQATMAVIWALALPAAMSYSLEVMQQLIPQRVPSARDLTLNVCGAALGTLVAALLWHWGALQAWQRLQERWFVADSASGMALLLLWPVALLMPQPLPLGLGQVFEPLHRAALAVLEGVTWAQPISLMIAPLAAAQPLAPISEALATASGLLAPSLLAVAITRGVFRRWVMVALMAIAALATQTLSTAINFSPDYALAWIGHTTASALSLAVLTALVLSVSNTRAVYAVALVVVTLHVVLVSQAPLDPYRVANLQAWEQGRFIRFHGLAQWVGWLWPYACMAWLLARLTRRR